MVEVDLEVEYWGWRERRELLSWDKWTARLGGASLLLLCCLTGVGEEDKALALAGVLVLGAVELLTHFGLAWYLPRRGAVLVVARILLATLHSARKQGFVLLQPAWLSIGWQLPFSQHVAVQSVVVLLATPPNVEKLCHGVQGPQCVVSGLVEGFDKIGETLRLLTWLSPEEGGGSGDCGEQCWRVAVFANLWLGWLVPTLWVWLADRASRRTFLMGECRERFGLQMKLPKPCLLARLVWCFNLFLFMEVTWQILKQIEKKTW